MNFKRSGLYHRELKQSILRVNGIEALKGSSILITGATGLIGSYIVDLLYTYNRLYSANIKVYALGRSLCRLRERFEGDDDDLLKFVESDVCDPLDTDFKTDYIIHAASNSYPAAFNQDPVGTIISNIQGTYNLLEYGRCHGIKRFLFVSSGEVYGQGKISKKSYEEDYAGYVDPVLPRSCYPNAKRAAETLCSSYAKQFGVETVIVRPSHTFGPNSTSNDNRAHVQFISAAMSGENIIMKSAGTQLRSYTYIADCVTAILSVLVNGENQNAYNIANKSSKATILEFAYAVAKQTGRKVVFELPDTVSISERTPIAKQVLDSKKLESLGWQGLYSLSKGICSTISVLKELEK